MSFFSTIFMYIKKTFRAVTVGKVNRALDSVCFSIQILVMKRKEPANQKASTPRRVSKIPGGEEGLRKVANHAFPPVFLLPHFLLSSFTFESTVKSD